MYKTMDTSTIDGDSSLNDHQFSKAEDIDIDTILSKELLQLSLKDRNEIDEEIHGVLTLAPKESPEFLEEALFKLSVELERIPDESPTKTAYLESQTFPKTYVNDRDFRLCFLRCDLFDANKAAMRILKFLALALEFFGPEALQRPIRFSDLDKGEEKLLRKGYVQVMPYRDRAGRPIHVWVGDFDFEGSPHVRNRVRVLPFSFKSDSAPSSSCVFYFDS